MLSSSACMLTKLVLLCDTSGGHNRGSLTPTVGDKVSAPSLTMAHDAHCQLTAVYNKPSCDDALCSRRRFLPPSPHPPPTTITTNRQRLHRTRSAKTRSWAPCPWRGVATCTCQRKRIAERKNTCERHSFTFWSDDQIDSSALAWL